MKRYLEEGIAIDSEEAYTYKYTRKKDAEEREW